jgi:hypothetical protein
MRSFNLPAGCQMRISATMEPKTLSKRRWSVALFAVGDVAGKSDPRANYGSRIGGGETQSINAGTVDVDCICEVTSSHQLDERWEPDQDQVTLDAAEDFVVRFHPSTSEASDSPSEDCTLSFEFSPPRAGLG